MNVLFVGIDRSKAVNILLRKKNAGTNNLHLLYLSIFKITVLKLAFAYLIFITSNLLHTKDIKNTGKTIFNVKNAYEAINATFLLYVETSPSTSFIIAKNEISK
jgi:hypothetical protein